MFSCLTRIILLALIALSLQPASAANVRPPGAPIPQEITRPQDGTQPDNPPKILNGARAVADFFIDLFTCFWRFLNNNSGIITFAFTAALVWFTRNLSFATTKLTEISNRNTDLTQSIQRAWLKIEGFKITQPTEFSEDGTTIRASFVIKNIGKTIATNVHFQASDWLNRNSEMSYSEAEAEFERILVHRVEMGAPGDILFPNDTIVVDGFVWGIEAEAIRSAIREVGDGRKLLDLTFFVGAAYKILGDSDTHLTTVPYGWLNIPIGLRIDPLRPHEVPPMPFISGKAY